MRKYKDLDPKLIELRQRHWDECIASNGRVIPPYGGLEYGYKEIAKIEFSAYIMRAYDRYVGPECASEVAPDWRNDPSYWWNKKGKRSEDRGNR